MCLVLCCVCSVREMVSIVDHDSIRISMRVLQFTASVNWHFSKYHFSCQRAITVLKMDFEPMWEGFPMLFDNIGVILPVDYIDPEQIVAQVPVGALNNIPTAQPDVLDEFLSELDAALGADHQHVIEPSLVTIPECQALNVEEFPPVITIPEGPVFIAEQMKEFDDFIAGMENIAPAGAKSRKPISVSKIVTIEGDRIRIQGSKYGSLTVNPQEYLELLIYLHGDKIKADTMKPVVDWQVDPEVLNHSR